MNLPAGLLRNNPAVSSLRRRGISIRHVAFTFVFSIALLTLYFNYLQPNGYSFPTGVIYYPPETPEIWANRSIQVRDAFLHAYHGYERFAFPSDELRPISNMSIDNFNGWAVTAVDSLDTMLIMGLDEEYKRAMSAVHNANFSLPENTHVPFFETVIRYLGGLLSAYALTKDDILRTRADELGTIMSPAFNTSSGFPMFSVNTVRGTRAGSALGGLAEIASYQMEYAYLGKITGKKEHVDRATAATRNFYNAELSQHGGMYPMHWNLSSGQAKDARLSVGAASDSAHEYTLKQYLMTARKDKANLEMYLRFTSHVFNNLMFISPKRQLLYVTDSNLYRSGNRPTHHFEHLSCFFPGLLALGAHTLPLNNLEEVGLNFTELADDLLPKHKMGYEDLASFNLADLHLWAAEGLAQTCYLTYADQPTGLGPDVITMLSGGSRPEIPWMDAMREWKTSGRKGPPPGVGDKVPWAGDITTRNAREREMAFSMRDYHVRNAVYQLRPETIESLYILYRVTGDVKWRHRGWAIFQAIEREAKTPSGYANVGMVDTRTPEQLDAMPSFFLAETLKYLYLLFRDDDIVPLDKWVFNTEAHPLPVFEWTQEEKEAYGVP
ncbi:glycoside hydrolase family 47 protein [Suillus ampliporus]|nr:glycoside hydrolase family 47 protein [Suillus ampliporus]